MSPISEVIGPDACQDWMEDSQCGYMPITWLFEVQNYYPTALKGFRGIVFTHGVSGLVGGRAEEKVCPV